MLGRKGFVVSVLVLTLMSVSPIAFAQSAKRTVQGDEVTLTFHGPGSKANPAEISFKGENYQKPLRVVDVTEADWRRSSPESSYRGMLSAAKSGDLEWILASFAPQDRERVKAVLSDPGARQRHHDFHKQVVHSEINMRIDYGEYAILLVTERQKNGRTITSEVAMKKFSAGWLGTNDLHEDAFFVMVLEAIKTRL